MDEEKIPLWRDDRVLKAVGQVIAVIVFVTVMLILGSNIIRNFQALGITFGFDFLGRAASFGIGDTPIPYTPSDSYGRAVLVGLVNSLRVMILGIILATVVGITVGVARLSENWLLRQIAGTYVELFRNTPLLLQLFCWYFAVFLNLPGDLQNPPRLPGPIFLTQRGVDMPWPSGTLQTWLSVAFLLISAVLALIVWRRRVMVMVQRGESGRSLQMILLGIGGLALLALVFGLQWERPNLSDSAITGGLNLSPEFGAVLFGLIFYTAAFIAEVVRAGIQSVTKGQWEAARALGLQPGLAMRLVIFPQALRVMIPPLTSEYLNLAKNSSLAIAVGYADVYATSFTTSNQTGRTIEMILILMATYLTINLVISLGMNTFNRSVQLKER
ncbi:MAG: ABC transporter permease subunit [Leptolyngbyaceae cyanobacterium SL_5_9]|nr:ABC transporter permease subunit [Leptolyngbyaceae cyanobacterium SL_5_9]